MSSTRDGLPTILIADDDPVVRKYLDRVVTNSGFTVIGEAGTGPDTLNLLNSLSPQLLILDLHLPGFSGVDVLRKMNPEVQTAVLIITADRDIGLMRRIVKDPVHAYLIKPIEPDQLTAAVHLCWTKYQEWQRLKTGIRSLEEEKQRLQHNLDRRKLLEQAKIQLIRRNPNTTEKQAHQAIQRMAMDQDISIEVVCNKIIGGQDISK